MVSVLEAQQLHRAYWSILGISLPIVLVLDAKSMHSALQSESAKVNPDIAVQVEELKQKRYKGECDDLVLVKGAMNPADPLTNSALFTEPIQPLLCTFVLLSKHQTMVY